MGSPAAAGDPVSCLWRIAGASVAGGAHLRANIPCQDASGWRSLSKGWAVFAVADGAGSASHADLGARVAVERSIEATAATVALHIAGDSAIEGEAWSVAMREIVAAARGAVMTHAADASLRPRDLACTLIILVLGPYDVVAAHIGDGAVVIRHRAGGIETLSPPEPGEYANEVNFLTGPDALDHLRVSVIRAELDAAALLTDGLQFAVLSYPDWKPKPEFFTSLLAAVAASSGTEAAQEGLGGLLASDRVRARTSDDVTLVVALRGAGDPVV